MMTRPQGPYCQSCGMPLAQATDFGTTEQGVRVNDYCHYCFDRGLFTQPSITMTGMIDACVERMVEQRIMPAGQARSLMNEFIPTLKRWRSIPDLRRAISPLPRRRA